MQWKGIHREIELVIRSDWGPDWQPARVEDRANLRIRLYQECRI